MSDDCNNVMHSTCIAMGCYLVITHLYFIVNSAWRTAELCMIITEHTTNVFEATPVFNNYCTKAHPVDRLFEIYILCRDIIVNRAVSILSRPLATLIS